MEEGAAKAAEAAHEGGVHVSLVAERLGEFAGLTITNTLVMGWLVVFVLTILALLYRKNVAMVPTRLGVIFESLIEFVYNYVAETLGNEKVARRFFPVIMSIFLFVLAGNLIQFLPGVETIRFFSHGDSLPLLRSLNTDLNVTIALALIAVIAVQFAGATTLGFLKYGSKFITFKSPMAFALGLIELISETARIVSFSFRLFGNILAGEVMIAIAAFFLPLILPVPLILFEVFVAFVQAGIFAILTLFFIKLAIMEQH